LSDQPRLVADSIGKSFSDRRVLSAARLSVSSGEVAGLLGRMGTGKSTLLRICAGIIAPDSGWVDIDGRQYSRPRHSTLASRGLFYIGELDNLVRTMTVKQHFDAVAQRFGRWEHDDQMEQLNVAPLLDQKASTLSGGEVKRVEMALAFARRPRVLLADELFKSADPVLCELIGASLRELARRGCAIVVTGHEVNVLRPYLDSVTHVISGTTYFLGDPDQAWANDGFRREYLGSADSAGHHTQTHAQ
jgi:lipopolysaccharide export system ATP-binding protein